MKKKLNLLKNIILLFTCALFLTGCASMSYMGDDFNPQSAGNIQTSAGFYFSTYKKHSNTENLDVTVGITKSTIPDIYLVYINIENLNNEDYILFQKDISYSSDTGRVGLVSSSQFINAYQSQETGTYASAQAIAPSISNIATIANNFQRPDQDSGVYMQNTRNDLNNQIGGTASDIAAHALNSASPVGARGKKYFYNFIEANEPTLVTVKFKDLEYKFGMKKKSD